MWFALSLNLTNVLESGQMPLQWKRDSKWIYRICNPLSSRCQVVWNCVRNRLTSDEEPSSGLEMTMSAQSWSYYKAGQFVLLVLYSPRISGSSREEEEAICNKISRCIGSPFGAFNISIHVYNNGIIKQHSAPFLPSGSASGGSYFYIHSIFVPRPWS